MQSPILLKRKFFFSFLSFFLSFFSHRDKNYCQHEVLPCEHTMHACKKNWGGDMIINNLNNNQLIDFQSRREIATHVLYCTYYLT